MRRQTNDSVGILVADRAAEPGFASEEFHRQLCVAGTELGLDVFVITPDCLARAGRVVEGFRPNLHTGGWHRSRLPLPKLVYDRHFAATSAEAGRYREALHHLLTAEPEVRLLGSGLPGKLQVQSMLMRDAGLARHLPSTSKLKSEKQLLAWLDRYGELFLKPNGGSQGRGALHVRMEPDGGLTVKGRSPRNTAFIRRFKQIGDAARWIMTAASRRPYLIQPYLSLTDSGGAAYDIRCLAQKDGSGRWQLTGMAVRRGKPGSITANLHGGGAAEAAEPYLEREFGGADAERIKQTLLQLSASVPAVLEGQHGRLFELGIDFGVDRDGRIWLLEVNSKPGRSSFAQIGRPEAHRNAVLNPLRYANYLLSRKLYPGSGLVIKTPERFRRK